MPLMREWTEIHVDEDLLIQVVQELLSLAADPNQVEVVYGSAGRIILCEIHLADAWYEARQALEIAEGDGTEVHASGFEVVASEKVENENSASSTNTVPTPAKRGSARKTSASPDGEEP